MTEEQFRQTLDKEEAELSKELNIALRMKSGPPGYLIEGIRTLQRYRRMLDEPGWIENFLKYY